MATNNTNLCIRVDNVAWASKPPGEHGWIVIKFSEILPRHLQKIKLCDIFTVAKDCELNLSEDNIKLLNKCPYVEIFLYNESNLTVCSQTIDISSFFIGNVRIAVNLPSYFPFSAQVSISISSPITQVYSLSSLNPLFFGISRAKLPHSIRDWAISGHLFSGLVDRYFHAFPSDDCSNDSDSDGEIEEKSSSCSQFKSYTFATVICLGPLLVDQHHLMEFFKLEKSAISVIPVESSVFQRIVKERFNPETEEQKLEDATVPVRVLIRENIKRSLHGESILRFQGLIGNTNVMIHRFKSLSTHHISEIHQPCDYSQLTNNWQICTMATAGNKQAGSFWNIDVKSNYSVRPSRPRLRFDSQGNGTSPEDGISKLIDDDSFVHIRTCLYSPIDKDFREVNTGPKITRIVILFKLDDDDLTESINEGLLQANMRSIPKINGSIRSYKLSDEEIAKVEELDRSGEAAVPSWDIVSGFILIDDDCRLAVLEGRADSGSMRLLQETFLKRKSENRAGYIILANHHVTWCSRQYIQFKTLDLKRIRLRSPLPMIMSQPSCNCKVLSESDEVCMKGLEKSLFLRKVKDLAQASLHDVFPTVEMLYEVERKFGETVTLEMIEGTRSMCQLNSTKQSTPLVDFEKSRNLSAILESLSEASINAEKRELQTIRDSSTKRKKRNFIMEQKETKQRAYDEHRKNMETRRAATNLTDISRVFLYSSQKMKTKETMLEAIRQRVAKDTRASYTYSADYISQTFPTVNDAEIKKFYAADKTKWKTEAGFVYPPPKDPREYNIHPKKPSTFRIDDLGCPFEDDMNNTGYVAVDELDGQKFILTSTGQKFGGESKWLGTNEDGLFGGYNSPQFATDYTSKLVGDRKKLPRGSIHLTKDPGFFSSVHLQLEGDAPEEKEPLEKFPPFIVEGFCQRDRPDQLARQDDILHGEPLKKSLRIVRNATLPSGKRVPLEPTPLTIVNVGPYTESQRFEQILRVDDNTKLITALNGGDGHDFTKYIHYGEFKPSTQTCVHRRKHAPISMKEGDEGLWGSGGNP